MKKIINYISSFGLFLFLLKIILRIFEGMKYKGILYHKVNNIKHSKINKYFEYATNSLKEMYRQVGNPIFDEKGLIKNGLIIRHLLLPQGTNEAIRVFDWVRKNVPNAYFSIMSQYLPAGRAEEMPIINRRVTKREYEKVLDYICGTDFSNVYIQERKSSDEKFIPEFDMEGI